MFSIKLKFLYIKPNYNIFTLGRVSQKTNDVGGYDFAGTHVHVCVTLKVP